jgi:YegS/Rv2252/BmrU family lipid kinase
MRESQLARPRRRAAPGNPILRSPAALVVNAASRHGADLYTRAVAGFEQRDIALTERHPVREPRRIPQLVQRLVRGGCRSLIVGGGDGTLRSIVSALVESETILGVLPLGTGNSFAQSLAIPRDLDGALDIIAQGQHQAVDVGRANDQYFVNAASIGLSAIVARRTAGGLKRVFGPLGYVLTGIAAGWGHRPFACTLESAEGTTQLHTHQVVIANGSVFGTTELGPPDALASGQLTVLASRRTGRWELARLWAAMLRGHPDRLSEVIFASLPAVRITTHPRKAVELDGELCTSTPTAFAVLPKALNVYVPANPRATNG